MSKTRFLLILSTLAMCVIGCGDSSNETKQKDEPVVDPVPKVVTDNVDMQSARGCAMDSDCVKGTFCFEGQCVVQCVPGKIDCEEGYKCYENRGRCVTEAFLQEAANTAKQIADAGDEVTPEMRAQYEYELDLKAAKSSDIPQSVLTQTDENGKNIERVQTIKGLPDRVMQRQTGAFSVISMLTAKSAGDVYYAVVSDVNEPPVLEKAVSIQNDDGTYAYGFSIDSTSILNQKDAENGSNENNTKAVTIVSSLGSANISVVPHADASGIYKGYAMPQTMLSGTPLPIRMAIETVPANPASFDEIQSLKLYLPTSENDVFSPENVVVDNGKNVETWAWVELTTKDAAASCSRQKPCFAATFSTNNYAPKNSVLFDELQKVNRNLRIEIYDYSPDNKNFEGVIKDRITGLYRITEVKNNNELINYNDDELLADFDVTMDSAFDASKLSIHAHNYQEKSIRDINDKVVTVCSAKDESVLLSSIKSPYDSCDDITNEDEKADCIKYENCQKANRLTGVDMDDDLRLFCTHAIAQTIVNDDMRLTNVLEKVLTKSLEHDSSSEPVAIACGKDIHNFKDFVEACDTEGCTLCQDRPELLCAADMLARAYLASEVSNDDKASVMNDWLTLMRESYLAQEYLAWSHDTSIRRAWIEGGNAYSGTFASNLMDDFNAGLLDRYGKEVLDVHHDIMRKQFTQTTLEMLSQSIDDHSTVDGSSLSSARNSILSEMAQTWESLAQSLGLDARRHDVLSQQDDQRLAAASVLRPVLFDLYYAGLIESNLNLRSDQGSLNASYGSNLGAVVSKLDSLDQTFEDLVFMRDGEILVDNRVVTDTTETQIGRLKKVAAESVSKATTKRKDVFKTIDDREMTQANIKDQYETDLEKMRAKIVELCGYPEDCKTDEEHASCKLMTDPYYCGFAFKSQDRSTLSLSSKEKAVDISQMICYAGCYSLTEEQLKDSSLMKLLGCSNVTDIQSLGCGGNLASEQNPVNYADGTNYSKAALAILDYRNAEQAYQTAVSNYDVMRLKVQNTFEMLNAYANNIAKWHEDRSKALKTVAENMEKMDAYGQGIVNYKHTIKVMNATELSAEAATETTALISWYTLNVKNQAQSALYEKTMSAQLDKWAEASEKQEVNKTTMFFSDLSQIEHSVYDIEVELNTAAAAKEGEKYLEKLETDCARDYEDIYGEYTGVDPFCIEVYNNRDLYDRVEEKEYHPSYNALQSTMLKRQGRNYSSYKSSVYNLYMEKAYSAKLEISDEIQDANFSYQIQKIDREKAAALIELQAALALDIANYKTEIEINGQKLSGTEASFKEAIAELERANEILLKNIENNEKYERDLQDLADRRTEYKNMVLDLIQYAREVDLKEIAKQRAYIEYMSIVQEAQLLASQYNNKFRRYQEISDITFSAAKFFQVASDLESAESFIEYARNDLNDYLTGLEYMTVRPYVDLRRSIYTARGTNEMELIKAQIDDLTNNCGTGEETTNKVNISLKNRLGLVDKNIGNMSSAVRFHNILRNSQLPISAQMIYSSDDTLGDLIQRGDYYSGSFDLTSTFANIATSCNAKVKDIRVRFVSVPGTKIRESGDASPTVFLVYGGQSQLLSCHANIDAITASIGDRTTFGTYSSFVTKPFGGGVNVGIKNVGKDEEYALSDKTPFSDVTVFSGFDNYPLMATYTLIFDPKAGENAGINWNNVADIEIQIEYTTGTMRVNDRCKYDIQ